jgi:hypothetical protein
VDLKAVLDIPNPPKCSSEVFDLAGIGSSTGPKIKYEWSTDIGKIISQNGFNAKAKGLWNIYFESNIHEWNSNM